VAALVQKAGLLSLSVTYGLSKNPQAAISESIATTEKAIQLDETAAGAHGLRGILLMGSAGREEEGAREVERGLSLNPLLPDVNYYAGFMWIARGNFRKGLHYSRRAQELWRGAANGTYVTQEIVALVGLERFEEAKAAAARALDHGVPKRFLVLNWVAVNIALGLPGEARELYDEVLSADPGFDISRVLRMYAALNKTLGQWYMDQVRTAGLI
jgi:tetratricopeptide (TPR) repeat protein